MRLGRGGGQQRSYRITTSHPALRFPRQPALRVGLGLRCGAPVGLSFPPLLDSVRAPAASVHVHLTSSPHPPPPRSYPSSCSLLPSHHLTASAPPTSRSCLYISPTLLLRPPPLSPPLLLRHGVRQQQWPLLGGHGHLRPPRPRCLRCGQPVLQEGQEPGAGVSGGSGSPSASSSHPSIGVSPPPPLCLCRLQTVICDDHHDHRVLLDVVSPPLTSTAPLTPTLCSSLPPPFFR